MGYYDALVAKWATLSGSTEEKIAAVNAATVPGPCVDVPVSEVLGCLLLKGAYWPLSSFAAGTPTGDPTHAAALISAKSLMLLTSTQNAPVFRMSDQDTFDTVKGMMDAILAQEIAAPGTTGFTQAVHDALLSLCATTLPWWEAEGGLTSPINEHDLTAAGGLV